AEGGRAGPGGEEAKARSWLQHRPDRKERSGRSGNCGTLKHVCVPVFHTSYFLGALSNVNRPQYQHLSYPSFDAPDDPRRWPTKSRLSTSRTPCAAGEVYESLVQALAECVAQFLLAHVPAAP